MQAKKTKIDPVGSITPQYLYASDHTGDIGNALSGLGSPQFEIYVEKADFKFNCAHFVAFKGFRERLHGHNYHASVKVIGDRPGILHEDGYLIDFGDVKKTLRVICKELNEYFICPTRSDVMTITEEDTQVCLVCEDGTKYEFPREDCAMLPIHHSTAEELAHYIYCRILEKLGADVMLSRGILMMEVGVAEAPGQMALFRSGLPETPEQLELLHMSRVKSPRPCRTAP